MTVNPLSLPTDPERAALFRDARGTAPFFDSRLKLWVVLDHEKVAELLLDGRLAVPEVDAALATVEQRYDIGLPNLRWAAKELPLVINGAAHRRARSGIAKLLSADRKSGGAWREPVRRLVRDAFAAAGPVEAVRGLLLPIVNLAFASLTQIDVSFEPFTLTRVFDHYTSYRQLVAVEQHIADLRGRLREAGIPDESIGAHAALVILGRDSLLSSLAEGVLDFVLNCRGHRLNDTSVAPPRLFGGVAIAERLVTTPFEFAGITFEKEQRIRLYLQGFSYLESETERLAMFGVSEHSCLGRALALEVWSVLASGLREVALTVQSVDFAYERHSIFTMPRFINLALVSAHDSDTHDAPSDPGGDSDRHG